MRAGIFFFVLPRKIALGWAGGFTRTGNLIRGLVKKWVEAMPRCGNTGSAVLQAAQTRFLGGFMKLAIIASAFVLSLSAQAGNHLGFEEIRDACLDPAKFQNQIAPTNLQVTCEDRSTKWKAVSSTTVELSRTREIVSSLTSDKYTVAPTTEYIDVASQKATCPRFKEVMETINFTKATSCEELIAFKGTETQFCADILDRVRESNPKAIEVVDTGNEVNLCEAKPQEPTNPCEGRGQRGQGGGRCQR
jgi:hypothetical protein